MQKFSSENFHFQIFIWKFFTVSEKSSKKRNDFTRLWRQWLSLLKVKVHLTSYKLRQYRR